LKSVLPSGVAVLVPLAVLTYAGPRAGTLREAPGAILLPVLIGVHTVRLLGVFFVLLFSAGRLPAPFAPVAGWGKRADRRRCSIFRSFNGCGVLARAAHHCVVASCQPCRARQGSDAPPQVTPAASST
jgi:hypothetical protein